MKTKRTYIILAVLILTIFLVSLCGCNEQSNLSDQVIRIHIRANSNLERDQAVKLKVRDRLTAFLTEELSSAKTKGDAYKKLQSISDEITSLASAVLTENGFDYGSNVYIGKETFPERSYGEYVFPEGEYDAVILNLGSGDGDNWWCVAFPPLCFSPTGDVVYKSWIKEMLEKINGLGIGPGGLGGSTTALAVNINTYATHIAGLPVAVNICCHVNRHVVREL